MYLMNVPAQYVYERPQLGFISTAAIAASAGSSGPAAPIVAAVLGIASLFAKLFHGADPRQAEDVSPIESGTASCYDVWSLVSGETIAGAGEPKTWKPCGGHSKSYVNTSTWSLRSSAYPNVPKGPLGDQSLDIDKAIAACQEIIDTTATQMKLQKSLTNAFFTNGGGGAIPLLLKVKAARQAAAATTAATSQISSSSSTTAAATSSSGASALLPIAAAGLLLWKLSAGG